MQGAGAALCWAVIGAGIAAIAAAPEPFIGARDPLPERSHAAALLRGEALPVADARLRDWLALPGIGPALAARIVAAREVAPFCRVDALARVRGIGPKTIEALRPALVLGHDPRCASIGPGPRATLGSGTMRRTGASAGAPR